MKKPFAGGKNIGQLFMVGLPGTSLDSSTYDLIKDYGINNFIFFKRNVSSPKQLKALCNDLQESCKEHDLPPAIISIDQEGGTVSRLSHPFIEFRGARELAGTTDPEKSVKEYAETCSAELKQVGINMNLAPVMDICPAGKEFFMEERVYGGEPKLVARLGCLVIETMQARGVAACAKHFPGLGAAVLDPHIQLPVVEKNAGDLQRDDFVPFKSAMACGVSAIMTSHAIYPAFDHEQPGTLSERILTGILRKELGFAGIIITDDLEMGAIENHGEVKNAALSAFKAGADVLLICHEHNKVRGAWHELAQQFDHDENIMIRISESVTRINAIRNRFV